MTRETTMKLFAGLSFGVLLTPSNALANIAPIVGYKLLDGVLSTILYSIIGIVMALISLKAVDFVTPGDLHKLLCEDKNVAIGVVVGLLMLGICIIIAAAVAG